MVLRILSLVSIGFRIAMMARGINIEVVAATKGPSNVKRETVNGSIVGVLGPKAVAGFRFNTEAWYRQARCSEDLALQDSVCNRKLARERQRLPILNALQAWESSTMDLG